MAETINILMLLLILCLCVVVHEMGHLVAAKRMKLPVKEFSIGFGPGLFHFVHNGTQYAFRALPFGGYVLMDERRVRPNLRWKLLLAGPVANFLLGMVFTVGYLIITEWAAFHSLFSVIVGLAAATLASPAIYLATIGHVLRVAIANNNLGTTVQTPIGMGIAIAHSHMGMSEWFVLGLVISYSVGFCNLLPIPPLDGGKIFVACLNWLGYGNKHLERVTELLGLSLILGVIAAFSWLNIVSALRP